MPESERAQRAKRFLAITGAPLALVLWSSALLAAGALLAGPTALTASMARSGLGSTVWWVAACALLLLRAGLHLWSRRVKVQEPEAVDDGRTLRVAAGSITVAGGVGLLALSFGWSFGDDAPLQLYAKLDAYLGTAAGAGLASLVAAAAALYLAEELPRACEALFLSAGSGAARAMRVVSMAVGLTLFVLSIHFVSHFSVGRALLGDGSAVAASEVRAAPSASSPSPTTRASEPPNRQPPESAPPPPSP